MSLLSLFKNTMQKQAIPDVADTGEYHSKAEEDTKPPRGNGKRKSSGSTSNSRAKAVDPVLPEKKRARRRLIGAIALVLAAVIGLPMLLDSEPKTIADDIVIQIPSKDKALPSVMPAEAKQAPQLPVATGKTQLNDAEPAEEIISSVSVPPVMPEKNGQPKSRPEQSTPSVSNESAVASKTTASSEQKKSGNANTPLAKDEVVVKAQSKAEAESAARALAILEGKSSEKKMVVKPDKAVSGYTLQVAALATQEKVNALQNTLKAAGIRSYTQKVTTVSGSVIRVRVGPFESKGEAEKMRAKLAKIGQSGSFIPH